MAILVTPSELEFRAVLSLHLAVTSKQVNLVELVVSNKRKSSVSSSTVSKRRKVF